MKAHAQKRIVSATEVRGREIPRGIGPGWPESTSGCPASAATGEFEVLFKRYNATQSRTRAEGKAAGLCGASPAKPSRPSRRFRRSHLGLFEHRLGSGAHRHLGWLAATRIGGLAPVYLRRKERFINAIAIA